MNQIRIPKWNVEELTGYTPKTTFWEDFSIADAFGADAVKDTFNRAFKEWHGDTVYLTELVMVLNHKIWQFHGRYEDHARVYNDLWGQASTYAAEMLKGDDLAYYCSVTD